MTSRTISREVREKREKIRISKKVERVISTSLNIVKDMEVISATLYASAMVFFYVIKKKNTKNKSDQLRFPVARDIVTQLE